MTSEIVRGIISNVYVQYVCRVNFQTYFMEFFISSVKVKYLKPPNVLPEDHPKTYTHIHTHTITSPTHLRMVIMMVWAALVIRSTTCLCE